MNHATLRSQAGCNKPDSSFDTAYIDKVRVNLQFLLMGDTADVTVCKKNLYAADMATVKY